MVLKVPGPDGKEITLPIDNDSLKMKVEGIIEKIACV